jgi:hypothetical protein
MSTKFSDAVPEPPNSGIVLRKWKDLTVFACVRCPFDSLHREKTVQHIITAHERPAKPAAQTRELTTTLFDASGRLITHL